MMTGSKHSPLRLSVTITFVQSLWVLPIWTVFIPLSQCPSIETPCGLVAWKGQGKTCRTTMPGRDEGNEVYWTSYTSIDRLSNSLRTHCRKLLARIRVVLPGALAHAKSCLRHMKGKAQPTSHCIRVKRTQWWFRAEEHHTLTTIWDFSLVKKERTKNTNPAFGKEGLLSQRGGRQIYHSHVLSGFKHTVSWHYRKNVAMLLSHTIC